MTELSEEEQATVSLFQQNTPSVVNIANIGQRQDRWTMDVEKVPQGLGSGFIWDLKGHIVTNYHVSTCPADVAALSGMMRCFLFSVCFVKAALPCWLRVGCTGC